MSEFLAPDGVVRYEGLDVSDFQGEIDWSRVRAAGKTAAYIRAGVGDDFKDTRFEENYSGARANGILVGFYLYVTARTTVQARTQARYFADLIRGKTMELCPAMDFEYFGSLSSAQINRVGLAFLEELEAVSGKRAAVYTDSSAAQSIWSEEIAEGRPLWIAEWGVDRPAYNDKWSGWAAWQYTDSGRVDGISSGGTDLDRFTDAILLSDVSPLPGTPSVPAAPDTKLIRVTVKAGDTLWEIAREYGTSVGAIVRLNGIENPDLIYPGERLYVRADASRAEPKEDYYTVKKGDTLISVARRFSTSESRLAGINTIRNPDLIFPGQRIRLGL